MHSIQISLAAAFAAAVGATPTPVGGAVPPCATLTQFNVTNKNPGPILGDIGTQSTVPMSCSDAGGGCTLGAQFTYTVTEAINVGLDLTLAPEDVATQAGLSVGYTHSTAKGSGESVSISCPNGPWDCAIAITPYVGQVEGWAWREARGGCKSPDGVVGNPVTYTAQFPQIVNGLPNVHAEGCACPNGPSPTAPGAPPVCPSPC